MDGKRASTDPSDETVPETPLWVKAFGVAALLVILVVVLLHLTGNGFGHHTFPQ